MSVIILTARTAAGTSSQFPNNKHTRKTLSASNLAGAEKVQLEYKHDSSSWVSMGSAYQLTASSPTLTIHGEGEYRAVKDATVGASSVAISS